MQNVYRLILSASAIIAAGWIIVGCESPEQVSPPEPPARRVQELPHPPRVAVLESKAARGRHVGDMKPVLEDLGWPSRTYLNTQYPQLLDDLDRYDVVIFSTIHNFDKQADLASGADRLRSFVEAGGTLVLCDLNYAQQTDWLSALDPRAVWAVEGERLNPHPHAPLRVVEPTHPLLHRVETPSPPWSQVTQAGADLTPLYLDADGKPVAAYLKLGKGVAVLSTLYSQYGWPDARFLENLVRWQHGLEPRPEPALRAVLAEPMFRGFLQSKDPDKRIVVQGACDTERTGEQRVEISLAPARQAEPDPRGAGSVEPLWVERLAIGEDGTFELTRSADGLPVGEYLVAVRSGTHRVELPLRVLSPADWEFTLDARGVGHVNGEAIFPLGMFHVSPMVIKRINKKSEGTGAPPVSADQMLAEMKSIGVNAAHYSWRMAEPGWIARCKKEGMWVVPTARTRPKGHFATRPDLLRQLLRDARPRDAVLMWYGVDEPTGGKLSTALKMRRLIERMDPHRPFAAAVNRDDVLRYTLAAYDIYMPDKYLLSDKRKTGRRSVDFRPLRDQVARARRVAGRNVAYWPVLQAFTIDKYHFPPPTTEQIRAQAFVAVASGASGIFWYAYWDGYPYAGSPTGRNQWVLSETPVFESLRTVHNELREWIPVVCHGKPGPEITCDDDRIVVRSWLHEGKVHVLAVNAVDQPVETTLQGPAGQAVMDRAGAASLRFEPLGVQSWILPVPSNTHK
jgi:hypothetical protein